MDKKQTMRIVFSILGGFVFAVLIFAICITVGYSQAYSSEVLQHEVTILGVTVYTLVREGSEYIGTPAMQGMSFVSMLFGIIFGIVSESWYAIRSRQKRQAGARA